MLKRVVLIFILSIYTAVSVFAVAYSYFDKFNNTVNNTITIGEWHNQDIFAGGNGTIGNPYQIENFYHLNKVRNYLTSYFILNNDLNSSSFGYNLLASSAANDGKGWNPIGKELINRFTGFFNGNGKKISNLYINRPDEDNVGLFGHIGISDTAKPTEIKNICLLNVTIIGGRATGSLIGRVTGNGQTVIKYACVSGGTVTGTGSTGGLIGSHNSFQDTGAADRNPLLLMSSANVTVYGIKNINDARIFEKIGGLAGCSQKGAIENCYSHSTVIVNNTSEHPVTNVGGIAGCNIFRGTLRLSYSTGAVNVNFGTNIGGLIGQVSTEGSHVPVLTCYWDYQSSGRIKGIGSSLIDEGAVGLTTANMQGTAAATNMVGFDFTNVWQTVTNNYPILRGF